MSNVNAKVNVNINVNVSNGGLAVIKMAVHSQNSQEFNLTFKGQKKGTICNRWGIIVKGR